MGLVRFLLAVTVVINHTGPLFGCTFTDAYMAIKIFFIISGYYMSLILSEKYTGREQLRLFYTNRLLRIFPLYWVMLLFSLLVSLFFLEYLHTALLLGAWKTWVTTLRPSAILTMAGANFTILGQDLLFFSHMTESGALTFARDALYQGTPAWHFLLIPQAWTVSLELVFYFMAPWLVRRSNGFLALLVAASFLLRTTLTLENFPADPWKQRFFPAEFGFFLLGIFAYRLYAALKTKPIPRRILWTIYGFYLSFLLFYQWLPGIIGKEIFLYAATLGSIPFLFLLTKKVHFDRMIGELSYPIYIAHGTIILLTEYFSGPKHLPILTLIGTVLFCLALNKLVADPIERYRQKRVLASR